MVTPELRQIWGCNLLPRGERPWKLETPESERGHSGPRTLIKDIGRPFFHKVLGSGFKYLGTVFDIWKAKQGEAAWLPSAIIP